MKILISLSTNVDHYTGTNGLYAWLQPSLKSVAALQDFLAPFKIEKPNDLHCTVVYSKVAPTQMSTHDVQAYTAKAICRTVSVKELAWWPGHDNSGYLVAKLNTDGLIDLHNKWKFVGAVPTFPNYEPHITLQTPCSEHEAMALIAEKNPVLAKVHFELTMLHEQVSDIG